MGFHRILRRETWAEGCLGVSDWKCTLARASRRGRPCKVPVEGAWRRPGRTRGTLRTEGERRVRKGTMMSSGDESVPVASCRGPVARDRRLRERARAKGQVYKGWGKFSERI